MLSNRHIARISALLNGMENHEGGLFYWGASNYQAQPSVKQVEWELVEGSLIVRINRYEKRFNQILLRPAVGFNQSRTKEILKSSSDFLGMKLNATERLPTEKQVRGVQHFSKEFLKYLWSLLSCPKH